MHDSPRNGVRRRSPLNRSDAASLNDSGYSRSGPPYPFFRDLDEHHRSPDEGLRLGERDERVAPYSTSPFMEIRSRNAFSAAAASR